MEMWGSEKLNSLRTYSFYGCYEWGTVRISFQPPSGPSYVREVQVNEFDATPGLQPAEAQRIIQNFRRSQNNPVPTADRATGIWYCDSRTWYGSCEDGRSGYVHIQEQGSNAPTLTAPQATPSPPPPANTTTMDAATVVDAAVDVPPRADVAVVSRRDAGSCPSDTSCVSAPTSPVIAAYPVRAPSPASPAPAVQPAPASQARVASSLRTVPVLQTPREQVQNRGVNAALGSISGQPNPFLAMPEAPSAPGVPPPSTVVTTNPPSSTSASLVTGAVPPTIQAPPTPVVTEAPAVQPVATPIPSAGASVPQPTVVATGPGRQETLPPPPPSASIPPSNVVTAQAPWENPATIASRDASPTREGSENVASAEQPTNSRNDVADVFEAIFGGIGRACEGIAATITQVYLANLRNQGVSDQVLGLLNRNASGQNPTSTNPALTIATMNRELGASTSETPPRRTTGRV